MQIPEYNPAPEFPEPTPIPEPIEHTQAQKKALSYLDYSAFSRQGLIDQLIFEGFTQDESIKAVSSLIVDWNEQAYIKAVDYLNYSSFSKQGLIDQLEFEGFTHSEAIYGAGEAYK
jgi:SOS response regulatory protein OraA/RecX